MEPFHAMENAKNTQKVKKYLRYVGKMENVDKNAIQRREEANENIGDALFYAGLSPGMRNTR